MGVRWGTKISGESFGSWGTQISVLYNWKWKRRCRARVSQARVWQHGARICDTDLWVRNTSGPTAHTAAHKHAGPHIRVFMDISAARATITIRVKQKESTVRPQHLAHDLVLNQTWGLTKSSPWHHKSPPALRPRLPKKNLRSLYFLLTPSKHKCEVVI